VPVVAYLALHDHPANAPDKSDASEASGAEIIVEESA
jgi:hypothetical protein